MEGAQARRARRPLEIDRFGGVRVEPERGLDRPAAVARGRRRRAGARARSDLARGAPRARARPRRARRRSLAVGGRLGELAQHHQLGERRQAPARQSAARPPSALDQRGREVEGEALVAARVVLVAAEVLGAGGADQHRPGHQLEAAAVAPVAEAAAPHVGDRPVVVDARGRGDRPGRRGSGSRRPGSVPRSSTRETAIAARTLPAPAATGNRCRARRGLARSPPRGRRGTARARWPREERAAYPDGEPHGGALSGEDTMSFRLSALVAALVLTVAALAAPVAAFAAPATTVLPADAGHELVFVHPGGWQAEISGGAHGGAVTFVAARTSGDFRIVVQAMPRARRHAGDRRRGRGEPAPQRRVDAADRDPDRARARARRRRAGERLRLSPHRSQSREADRATTASCAAARCWSAPIS